MDSPEADAELIAIAVAFFQEVGLSLQAQILVNNRELMDGEFAALGIAPGLRPDVLRLIDRRDKMPPDEWYSYAQEIGLNDAQFAGLQSVLSNTGAVA